MYLCSYECLDPTRLVSYAKNISFSQSQVQIECLYNGQWSYDIKQFGCAECERQAAMIEIEITLNAPLVKKRGKRVAESFNSSFICMGCREDK